MQNKREYVQNLLSNIYDTTGKLIVSRKQIKKVESYFAKYGGEYDNISDFLNSDKSIKSIVDKMKSGKAEISKQLSAGKALQPGILFECNIAQTCAKILGLRSFVDLENISFADTPIELAKYVKEKSDTLCAARYIYYNKGDSKNMVIQYGNPKAGDMAVIVNGCEVVVEIKDMPALLMDKDLLYDDKGKIIVTQEIKELYPAYVKYIENFNKNTSVIKHMGSNYRLFSDDSDHSDARKFVKDFLDASNIDVIITATKKDELIAIAPEHIDYIFPDNTPLISTAGSEIRTTGKNSLSGAFAKDYLEDILKEKDVEVVDEICKVLKTNKKVIGKVHGRGKDKNIYTRFKISHAFFVRMDDVTETEECFRFDKSKIRQCKAGISIHVGIKKTKKEIQKSLFACAAKAA